jgi:uncharacterized protein
MPLQPGYPGVYIQETPDGVRNITGVSTSVAIFIGRTIQGPVNVPFPCRNYSDFEHTFTADTSQSELASAVKLFFLNGGTDCYIMRIDRPSDPGAANNAGEAGVPLKTDYDNAYSIIDKEVDIFNLLVLPADKSVSMVDLWDNASIFCHKRRAFLLIDPPESWKTVQAATDVTSGVNSLRNGLVKENCAVFYPRVTIRENNMNINTGPAGAIAGLIARTDSTRGVWKAPAGVEAVIRGINGLGYRLTDQENGTLNPRGINALRIFPNGIVNWGARTMDGDDDFASVWKYIPVRRTALYIEESLSRGLQWAVFETYDESLWSQIRLNVGAFMHNLYCQGAFQGQRADEAYFVKCDNETNTPNDIMNAIANLWVGFAPLKPAEFIFLQIRLKKGEINL